MRLLSGLLLCLLHSLHCVSAEEDLGPAVVRGTEENWNDFLDAAPLVMVGFFAPWCGHCKKIKPHWNELANHYRAQSGDVSGGEGVSIAAVDVVAEQALYWKFDIQAYPTIKLFRKGVPVGDCDARTKDDLINWVEERRAFLASSIHHPSTPEDLLALRQQDKTLPALKNAVVGLFRPQDSLHLEAFRSLALRSLSSPSSMTAGGGLSAPPPPVFGVAPAEAVDSLASTLSITSLPAIVSLRAFADAEADEELARGLTGLPRDTLNELGLLHPYGAVGLEFEELELLGTASEGGDQITDLSRLVEGTVEWLSRQRYPPLLRWSAKHKPFVFTRRPGFQHHVLVLLPRGDEASASTVLAFERALAQVAMQWEGKALFLSMREGDDEASQLFPVFGVGSWSLPAAMAVVSNAKDNSIVFHSYPLAEPDNTLPSLAGPEAVADFVQDFFGGKLMSRSPSAPAGAAGASSGPSSPVGKGRDDEAGAAEVDESNVVVLRSEEAFDSLLVKHDLALIEAYAPWCGHCKKLKPIYAKAATALVASHPDIAVAKFDATAEPLKELAGKLGVEGFPTLLLAHQGTVFKYDGERTFEGIVGAMEGYATTLQGLRSGLAPEVVATTSSDLIAKMRATREADLKQQPAPRTLLLLTLVPPALLEDTGALAGRELAGLLAFSLKFPRDESLAAMGQQARHVVASADSQTLAALVGVGAMPAGVAASVQEAGEAVVALMPLDSPILTSDADFLQSLPSAVLSMPGILATNPEGGASRVLGFMRDSLRSPVVVYGDNPAFEALLEATHVKQLLILDDFGSDFDVRELTHIFEPVVANFNRRVCIVVVDARHTEALDFFNLQKHQLPASRLVDVAASKSFLVDLAPYLEGETSLQAKARRWAIASAKALDLAFDQVHGNRLPAVGRSEPRHAARLTTPLKKVVGDMWAEYVLERPSFDLLIEYFDPSCPHCKKMQPVLDTLALAAFEEGRLAPRGKLIMVQLDATANDPDDWDMPSGVPAIHFYPAVAAGGKRTKDDYVPYTGGADRVELVRFIEEHAGHTPIWTTVSQAAPESASTSSRLAGAHAEL